ncbi:MAG: PAS domain S-box protein [Archaeoglobaceae archaeon]
MKSIMNLTEKKIKLNERRIIVLLGIAIFSSEFLIVSVMRVSSLNIFSTVPLYILHNFGILILVVSPLLLILPGFIESNVRLEKLNSVLGAVRRINENINRETDVEKMLSDACKVLWKADGYFNVTLYDGELQKLAESGIGLGGEIPYCIEKAHQSKEAIMGSSSISCKGCPSYGRFEYCMIVPYPAKNDTITLAVFKQEKFEDEEMKLLEEVAVDIGVAIDKYRADKVIRENEEKYRTTFEHTGTAMMIIEEDTTLSLVNEEFVKLTGYSKEQVEGKMSWTHIMHPEDVEWMKEYHYQRREGQKPPKRYECRAIDKKGDVLNTFLIVDLIPGTNKSVASLIDITHFKKLNSLLKSSSDINGLVAREKNPAVVLRSVCKKLTEVYEAVFIFKNDVLEPIEWQGIDFDRATKVIKNCKSVSEAVNGYTSTRRIDGSECNECIDSYNYVLALPLMNNVQRGVVVVLSNSNFNEDEISLLRNLSENIAFALSAYNAERERKAALEQLAQNLTQFDKSADRLRNPLAVITSSMDLKDELGRDEVMGIIDEQVKRIEQELNALRREENKTYELTKKLKFEN